MREEWQIKEKIHSFKRSIYLTKKSKNIEILWAIQERHITIFAKQLKCNIITMPPKIIKLIAEFGASYNSMTINTVKGFLNDSKKSKFKI